jgi:hypothetical protein
MNDLKQAVKIEITHEMNKAGVWAFGAYADELTVAVPESSLAALASEVYKAMRLNSPDQISLPR